MRKIYKLVALTCFIFAGVAKIEAQGTLPKSVVLTVVDEAGQPLVGVKVNGPLGTMITDPQGECIVKTGEEEGADVLFSLVGFQEKSIKTEELTKRVVLSPKEGSLYDSELVDMGVTSREKREIATSVSTIDMEQRMQYNSARGVASHLEALMIGVKSGTSLRGISNALYVIDGVPGRDISLVDANEVESITVLKDAAAAVLYGVNGYDGVIIVKTKRGKIHKNQVKVSADYNMSFAKAYPDYLGAAEYMTLYNEAQANDGLTTFKYSQDDIDATASGLNPYKYPDVDFYSDQFLKDYVTNVNAMAEFSGGTEELKYYLALDYGHAGTIEKVNPNVQEGRNDFKLRGNLDFKVNSWINSTVDALVSLQQQKSAHTSLLSSAGSFLPNLYAPLLPISMMDEYLLDDVSFQSVKQFDGYVLGGSSSYKTNIPFANIFGGGYYKQINRMTQVDNTISFDLDMITKGLSANTRVGFDYWDNSKVAVNNTYNFYEPAWIEDKIYALTPLGEADKVSQVEEISTTGFILRYTFSGMLNYDRVFNDIHGVKALASATSTTFKKSGITQTDIANHLAFSLGYDLMRRYYVNLTTGYVHSNKLSDVSCNIFSPTVSLGYILSDEAFIRNSAFGNALDMLKLKASWGLSHSDESISDYFYYQKQYDISTAGSFSWADGTQSEFLTGVNQGKNDALSFLWRDDKNAGFEIVTKNGLSMEANYFRTEIGGTVSKSTTSYPLFYSTFVPYVNINKTRYEGVEVALNYEKQINDFSFNVGATYLYSEGKQIEVDEVTPEYDYLSTIGRKTGCIEGLLSEGLYQESDFENGVLKEGLPEPQFGDVQPGDIKYTDLSGDDKISDLDKTVIATGNVPHSIGANILLRYKNISLFVLGKGAYGAQGILNHGTYYWVNGDEKYSAIVRNRWTPETAETATYPRLTTGTGTNNYRNSTFWLYDNSFFDIRRVEVTYEFDKSLCQKLGLTQMSVNVVGENLWKFAENRDVLELNVSGNPQYRTVSLGLNVSL